MSAETTITPLVWDGDRAPLAKAFVAAQKATESIYKAATNPAFKSRYADLSAVVEGVIPALNKSGVGVIQAPGFDGDMVSVTTTLIHESGSSVTSTLHLRPTKSDPQGVGSALTYGRRYSLLAMTGSAPEDDDGQAASVPHAQQARPEPKRADPKPPTLAERAERLAEKLRHAQNESQLVKVRDLGEGLRAELDKQDPELLAYVDKIYEDRLVELSRAAA